MYDSASDRGIGTITVRSLAASLITDPSIKGPSEDTSATIQLAGEIPIVKIGVPTERPITQRPVPITFDWFYSDGTSVPVENFDLTDTDTDVGTIGNFAQVTGDASKYTAELTIPQSTTNTKATITVSAGSAQVANSNPAILGPEEDTSRTFEIAAPTAVAQVTGADSVCVLEKDIIENDYLNDAIAHLGSDAGGAFTGVPRICVDWRLSVPCRASPEVYANGQRGWRSRDTRQHGKLSL